MDTLETFVMFVCLSICCFSIGGILISASLLRALFRAFGLDDVAREARSMGRFKSDYFDDIDDFSQRFR